MKPLLLFFVCLYATSFFGQKKEGQQLIDSLLIAIPKMAESEPKVDALNTLALTYRLIDIKYCEENAKKALDIALKINYTDGIAYAYRNIGIANTTQNDYENALLNYDNALKTSKNKKIRGQIMGSIGKVYFLKGDYPKSLDYAYKSLTLFEEINDKQLQSNALLNISNTYIILDNAQKAKLYREKSAKILLNEKEPISEVKNEIKNETEKCLTTIKDTQKANKYYSDKLKLASKKGLKIEKVEFLIKESKFLIDSGKYNDALQVLNPLLLSEENKTENKTNIASVYYLLGDAYLEKYKANKHDIANKNYLNQAIKFYQKRIELISDLDVSEEKFRTYNKLYIAYKLQGNYAASLNAYEKATAYKDSIFNNDTKETIKNLEDKREIELRDKQIQLNKVTLESKEKQKWYLISGLLLLGIIGSLLFYQSRNRKKTNEKLQVLNTELDNANKTKARFFSILNHDLRSPVSNLIHFLHLQKHSPELLDDESKNRLENKTITGAENLLTSMEDILLWSKGQMENFKPHPKNLFVKDLFDDTKKHFESEEKVSISFENPENIEIISDENYLKTIIRNLTGNAIKALNNTENPTIIWKAWQENSQTYLSIKDNVSGASQEQFKALYDEKEVVGIKSGLGLHLIRDLAKAIQCEIVVESSENGTQFTLKIA